MIQTLSLKSETTEFFPELKTVMHFIFEDNDHKMEFTISDKGKIQIFTEGCVVPTISLNFLDKLVQALKSYKK